MIHPDGSCSRIHQGDSYRVYLEYFVNDEPMKNEYTEIEFTIKGILQNGVSKEFKYYFSKGEVSWDDQEEMFYIRLSQEETFLFNQEITYQIRLYLPNGDVYADNMECNHASIGESISKTVLEGTREV